jgi:hypothetical protein
MFLRWSILRLVTINLVTANDRERLRPYLDVFIEASELQKFNDRDLGANQVTEVPDHIHLPSFVSSYLTKLEGRRSVAPIVCSFYLLLLLSLNV